MKISAKFYKVSEKQYLSARPDSILEYNTIPLPKRATKGSAGYDFYAPFDFALKAGESVKIPTGIRAKLPEDWVLMLYPRSSLGFGYRLQLDNTVGVIDSDYYYADNEGHIFVKITNDSRSQKALEVKQGDAFCQGIFMPYGITEDDNAQEERTGGIGSTNKNGD